MSMKRFKQLSKVLENIFKVMSISLAIGTVSLFVGAIVSIFGNESVTQSLIEMTGINEGGFHLFTSMSGELPESSRVLALTVSGFILRGFQSYIC